MNRFDIGDTIARKVSHNLSSCNPPRARKRFASALLMSLLVEAVPQTVSSLACNSDSEILAALQTVETVVPTQRYRLDADKFPMFSVGSTC